MASNVKGTWMWGDASFLGHGLAKRNPLRWSATRSLEDTIHDLKQNEIANPARPVKLRLQRSEGDDQLVRTESEVEQAYPSIAAAIEGLVAYLPSSATDADGTGQAPRRSRTATSEEGEVQSVFRLGLREHLAKDSTATVRWMWRDAQVSGLRKLAMNNPYRWSEWCSLETAMADLEAFEYTNATESDLTTRPVSLQIKSTSADGSHQRYETGADTIVEARATLEDILDMTTCLKDRSIFSDDADAEKMYQEYANSTIQEHGGGTGALVRFTSAEGHPFLRDGQDGVIQQFDRIDKFSVNWGVQTSSVSMQQCILIATADKALHLEGVKAESVLSNLMSIANDHLKKVSEDTAAFERFCKRISEMWIHDEESSFRAADCGMCDTVVEAMAKDRERDAGPTRSFQFSCCLMLWFVIHPRSGAHRGGPGVAKWEEAKAKRRVEGAICKAVEAGALNALVKACEAFPKDNQLVDIASDTLKFLVKDSEVRRELAVAAGWKDGTD